jgi:hypothetical protein
MESQVCNRCDWLSSPYPFVFLGASGHRHFRFSAVCTFATLVTWSWFTQGHQSWPNTPPSVTAIHRHSTWWLQGRHFHHHHPSLTLCSAGDTNVKMLCVPPQLLLKNQEIMQHAFQERSCCFLSHSESSPGHSPSNRWSLVAINLYCQLDWVQRHLGD